MERRRSVMTDPGRLVLTYTPSLMPRSAKAFGSARIAALIVPTCANDALGVQAEVPEVIATDPW
jgi:hypothetical protein